MNDRIQIKDLDDGVVSNDDFVIFQLAVAPYTVYKTTKLALKGDKGDTGAKGDQGIQGIQGIQGVAGADGTDGTDGDDGADGISFIWEGTYAGGTTYQVNDVVSYNGSSYVCILESTGNVPTNDTYWSLMAQKGSDGEGSGDISGSGVANEIAYFTAEKTIDNLSVATYPSLTELSYVKGVTSAIQTQIGNLVPKATYNAHTVLYATTDNTPVALTVSEQTVVGRATGGNISAIAIDSDLSSVSASDDTIPSAKATKAMGDTKLPLAGGTMSGSITLGENTSIALDPAGSADGKWSGITVAGTAGYSQSFGDLVYLDPTDSRWEATDANSSAGADGDARGILGMVVSAGTDGNACTILLHGIIRADAKFDTFTINNPIYVSETAGAVTQTQPTTADVVIRFVGSALTADEMYFNPDRIWYTHV